MSSFIDRCGNCSCESFVFSGFRRCVQPCFICVPFSCSQNSCRPFRCSVCREDMCCRTHRNHCHEYEDHCHEHEHHCHEDEHQCVCVDVANSTVAGERLCITKELCTLLRLPPYRCIKRICVEIKEVCCKHNCLRIILKVRIFFVDKCGDDRECSQVVGNTCCDIACCHEPEVELCDDPEYEISGCSLRLKIKVKICC